MRTELEKEDRELEKEVIMNKCTYKLFLRKEVEVCAIIVIFAKLYKYR